MDYAGGLTNTIKFFTYDSEDVFRSYFQEHDRLNVCKSKSVLKEQFFCPWTSVKSDKIKKKGQISKGRIILKGRITLDTK